MLIKPLKWKLFHNNDEMSFLNHRTKWSPPESVAKPWRSQIKPIWTKPWQWVGEKYKTNTAHLPAVNPAALCFFFSSDQISAPFEIGVTLRAEDLADYIVELQEIVQRLLGNTESAGCPFFLVYTVKKVFPLNITIYLYIYILFSPERPSPRWRSETVSVFSKISFSYLSY